jgi:5-methylcytosine-specific restriction endonuclease McrA
MPRAVKEWIGRRPEAQPPPRVKLRIWWRQGGRCAECRREVYARDKPQFDHVVALVNGGEHRESNLRMLCGWCHGQKTRADVREKARVAARAKSHFGLRSKRSRWPYGRNSPWKKKINGEVVRRTR